MGCTLEQTRVSSVQKALTNFLLSAGRMSDFPKSIAISTVVNVTPKSVRTDVGMYLLRKVVYFSDLFEVN
jgi:hypothetical protein